MLKNLVLIAVIYLVYRTIKTMMLKGMDSPSGGGPDHSGGNDDLMIKCPQCDVYFPQREGISKFHKGQTLYFCSEKCRDNYK